MAATISGRLARWTASLTFEELPQPAVQQAKRLLLDSLGCALGGLEQPDVRIVLELLDEHAGRGPCAVIGSARRVDPLWATLANSLMIRVLDYNDIYWSQDPCHPSDLIPAAIAAGERAGRSGRDLLLGIVLGHELSMRLCESAVPGLRERGWHHATLTGLAAPLVAGKLLGLDEHRLAQAVGIAGSCTATLGAVTAGELTMMKNAADPLACQAGVRAALLAERGFSGPEPVIEGPEGLVACLGPAWRLESLERGLGEDYRITRSAMKAFPVEWLAQGPVGCVLDLVREHDLAPQEIERVEVRCLSRAAAILADPAKYDPRSKETADHSLPFAIAAAIVERELSPRQFRDEALGHPAIRAQLRKVEVLGDPEFDARFPELQCTRVRIHATGGRAFEKQVDYPRGDPRQPLADREIEEKFDALAASRLAAPARRRLRDACWNLDDTGSIAELMRLTHG